MLFKREDEMIKNSIKSKFILFKVFDDLLRVKNNVNSQSCRRIAKNTVATFLMIALLTSILVVN